VKSEHGDAEPEFRAEAEARSIGCSDVITASCVAESHQLQRLYGADPERIRFVAPGVERAFFSPGHRDAARNALDLPKGPIVLFVGRIQPLKGVDLAVSAFAAIELAEPFVAAAIVRDTAPKDTGVFHRREESA